MLFFENKPTQFVGIDIGSGGIKLVELKAQNKRPYLFTYAFSEERVPFRYARNDEERAAAIAETAVAVKAVAAAAKTSSNVAVASLPQRDVFSTIITIPEVEQKEFASAVAHEVEKVLPFPLAEAVLDTRKLQDLPKDVEQYKKTTRVFITAARRKVIQFYTDIFQQAGFKLQSIETETFATVRALLGNDPSPLIIIDMGKQFTGLSYIDRTIPYADIISDVGGDAVTKVLATAWNKSPEETESLKIDLFSQLGDSADPTVTELLTPIYNPIFKQIESLLEIARRSSSATLSRPDKIILTGGAALCPQLCKKIEDHFSIKTYVGDPWARVLSPTTLKPVLDRVAPRFAVAAGLAERPIIT